MATAAGGNDEEAVEADTSSEELDLPAARRRMDELKARNEALLREVANTPSLQLARWWRRHGLFALVVAANVLVAAVLVIVFPVLLITGDTECVQLMVNSTCPQPWPRPKQLGGLQIIVLPCLLYSVVVTTQWHMTGHW